MKLGISSSLVVCVLSLTLSVACAFDEFEVNDSSLEVALLEVFTLVPNPVLPDLRPCDVGLSSKPVAITVTTISSCNSGLITVRKSY